MGGGALCIVIFMGRIMHLPSCLVGLPTHTSFNKSNPFYAHALNSTFSPQAVDHNNIIIS